MLRVLHVSYELYVLYVLSVLSVLYVLHSVCSVYAVCAARAVCAACTACTACVKCAVCALCSVWAVPRYAVCDDLRNIPNPWCIFGCQQGRASSGAGRRNNEPTAKQGRRSRALQVPLGIREQQPVSGGSEQDIPELYIALNIFHTCW